MRSRRTARALLVASLGALLLAVAATPAQATRALLSSSVLNLNPNPVEPSPPPDGQVEDACGLALIGGGLYVSEYYRNRIDVFNAASGVFSSQLAAPNLLDGVCGLAFSAGALYANEWHEGVVRVLPSVKYFDTGHESTGVAVDGAGDVYALDRTYVAVYQPSGAPVLREGQPLEIGRGSLGDAYGIAVSASGGRVYVADAASDSVRVFEPGVDPDAPAATISHPFTSLVDSALALDPTNSHLLVLDNLQPGFTHPEAAIDEFAVDGTFLGQITAPAGLVHGGPSGMAVDNGNLYVTSGNSEGSQVLEFGPYISGSSATSLATPLTAARAPVPPERSAAAPERTGDATPSASASEVIQRAGVRVTSQARLTPKRLPRAGRAPVHFSISAKVAAVGDELPPQLRVVEIAINRNGRIHPGAVPVCEMDQVQPASTQGAIEACRRSLVGNGTFSANILLAQEAPFPSEGKVLAFNGRWKGKPAILAHIYGTKPVPTSYTLPFAIGKDGGKGTFGTTLKAPMPRFTSKWGYVTGISLSLGRSTSKGDYLTAGCPAPKGFGSVSFPLARTSLFFAEGSPREITQTLTRSCGAR